MLGKATLLIPALRTDDRLAEAGIPPQAFSYHHYYRLGERAGGMGHERAQRRSTKDRAAY